jgi:ferredoxin-NADP reductase
LAGAFAPSLLLSHQHCSTVTSTTLRAEGEAPQYETRNVVLLKAEPVGEDESAVLLHIDREEGDEEPFTYEPGHVLALEIQYNATRDTHVDNKTMKDAQKNEMWMRGPYTVSAATPYTLNILTRTVGAKSRAFAQAEPGTPLRVGGKFKVPIAKGISDQTKRVVLISTGVGIGPCVGAIEQMLSSGTEYTVDLISSFRFPNQVIYKTYLEFWQEAYEGKFTFIPIVTDEVGRLSASDENLKLITDSNVCSLTQTHYHLIGNGQMVNEFKQGLLKAGVPKEKVTLEVYFNHKEPANQEAIDRIATTIKAAALVNGASKQ